MVIYRRRTIPPQYDRRQAMLERLQKLNSDIAIFSVFSAEFESFGRVINTLKENDLDDIIKAAEKLPTPDGVSYLPAVEELEACAAAKYIEDELFGALPTQVGYCHGHNSLMNATEWHTSSEINIAVTPIVLILGDRRDIEGGRIDSSKFKAFYLPKGTAVEIYATTLHYTPCQASGDGFGCIVALPRGTNTALESNVDDKFMTAKNKWLIAHIENTAKIKQGAFAGITGKNTEIKHG